MSKLGLLPNRDKSELVPVTRFIYVGMEFLTRVFIQGSLCQSRRDLGSHSDFPGRDVSDGQELSVTNRQAQCGSGFSESRPVETQTGSVRVLRTLEPDYRRVRMSGSCHAQTQTDFTMVDVRCPVCKGSFCYCGRSGVSFVYGCQAYGLGCTSGTIGSFDQRCVASESEGKSHIPTGNGSGIVAGPVLFAGSSQQVDYDSYGQHYSGSLYQSSRGTAFQFPVRSDLEAVHVLQQPRYEPTGETYTGQEKHLGRPSVSVFSDSFDGMDLETGGSESSHVNTSVSERGSVRKTIQQQATDLGIANIRSTGNGGGCNVISGGIRCRLTLFHFSI